VTIDERIAQCGSAGLSRSAPRHGVASTACDAQVTRNPETAEAASAAAAIMKSRAMRGAEEKTR
jgi:hypothetical protein